jgi:Putative prokaryotic signal transducing protein
LNQEAVHDWVRADSFTDILHANIVRGRLEAEGVPAMIANEHTITADWTYSLALGGVRIMVPPQYLTEARDIIRQIDRGEFADEDEGSGSLNDNLCSVCQEPLTRKQPFSWKLSLLVSSLSALPIPFSKNQYQCSKCKK